MKFIYFHSSTCIWKYRLRVGVHFVSTTMCWNKSRDKWNSISERHELSNYYICPRFLTFQWLGFFLACRHRHLITWCDVKTSFDLGYFHRQPLEFMISLPGQLWLYFCMMTFVPVQQLCVNIYIYMLFYMSSVFFDIPIVSCTLMTVV